MIYKNNKGQEVTVICQQGRYFKVSTRKGCTIYYGILLMNWRLLLMRKTKNDSAYLEGILTAERLYENWGCIYSVRDYGDQEGLRFEPEGSGFYDYIDYFVNTLQPLLKEKDND